MNANAFVNKTERPTDAELAVALGAAKPVWDKLLTELSGKFGASIQEWKCYSPKWGWALHAKRKKRTIVWLSPHKKSFGVLFILGEKAMQAARETKLPSRAVKALQEAPTYPEGSGVRFEIKSSREIRTLEKLAAIKVAN